jgi:hypothetical protein
MFGHFIMLQLSYASSVKMGMALPAILHNAEAIWRAGQLRHLLHGAHRRLPRSVLSREECLKALQVRVSFWVSSWLSAQKSRVDLMAFSFWVSSWLSAQKSRVDLMALSQVCAMIPPSAKESRFRAPTTVVGRSAQLTL